MSKNIIAPPVRFQGFTAPWRQRKFADLATVRRGLTYKPHNVIEGGKRVLRSSNINENTFQVHNDDVFVDENVVNIPCVNNGDILITSANGSSRLIGKHAIIRGIPENSAVHGGFMLLASSDESEFVNALMSSLWYTKFINAYVAGGNGAIGNLNKNDLEEQIAYVPQKEEMHKIGDFFGNLDHLITLHQHKLELQKKLKAFFLQNMFPEEGETVPRIRFKGFTGDWEQRKFADLATVRRGLTYKPHNVIEGGKRVLRSSNINENTFQVHNDDVFVDENVVNIPCVNNGDILITSANGSSRLIGKHAIIRGIPENSAVHGGFMLLASSDESEFVNALMSSLWYTKFINAYVAGGNGAIGNLNKNDLEEQIAYAPQKEEMHKIGDFFENLDHLITIHQRKIDQLQAMKKFMLQNLFV